MATTSSRGRRRASSSCSPRAAAATSFRPRGRLDSRRHAARDARVGRRPPALRLRRTTPLPDRLGCAHAGRGQSAPRRAHPSPRRPQDRRRGTRPRGGGPLRPSGAARLATIDVRSPPTRARETSPRRSSPTRRSAARCTNGAHGRREQPHARPRLPPRHRLSFGRWRTLVRLQAAVCTSPSRSREPRRALVGYRTTSAYVAAFRAHTGVTPGRYFQRLTATPLPARRAEALAGARLSSQSKPLQLIRPRTRSGLGQRPSDTAAPITQATSDEPSRR